jgi:serine/threonine protein phosphatase PrpC
LAKKLRVAAAGLTDVGRRRERNQDNTTHYVPDNEDVLEQKGALFVVCDGMGGHAAGEVAAEIGVNSLREVYFQSEDPDIITGVANAIKHANQAIYSYAREHAGMTGMGTTCVALVIHGGRGYFLNIGDSRAYIVRSGTMRQVTLDHSWVAEQVRAGILTEEQARTHAHRNVITRSLGTQPTVSADLFVETLHDGDRVLLCSDGLHGYVEEREIEREMREHSDPEIGARHMIEMANDNGGPDNITALIVHMLEVPEVTGELTLPLPIEEDPEQVITRPVPTIRAPQAPPAAEILAEKQAALRRVEQARPNRVAAAAVRLLAIAALVLVSLGVWDLGAGPYAQMRVATDQVQADVAAAQSASQQSGTQDPKQALSGLAQARNRLVADLSNPLADPASKQNAQTVLDQQLVPAVQSAIARYNSGAQIETIAPSGISLSNVGCATHGQSGTTPLAGIAATAALPLPPVKPGTGRIQTLFVLDNGVLYEVALDFDATGTGTVPCGAVTIPNVATVAAVSADGGTLYALGERSSGQYVVLTVAPNGFNGDGTANAKTQERFNLPTPQGEVPALLAVRGGTAYVGYKPGASGPSGIWVYPSPAPNAPAPIKPAHTVALPQAPASLAATGTAVYALLADGSLGAVDASYNYSPVGVQVLGPLAPAVTSTYSAATPVPTASSGAGAANGNATGSTSTLFSGGALLLADPAMRSELLVSDPANGRLVRFTTGSSAVGTTGLGLSGQYVYSSPPGPLTGLATTSDGSTLTVYGWSGSQLATFATPEPPTGA